LNSQIKYVKYKEDNYKDINQFEFQLYIIFCLNQFKFLEHFENF